jgi:hypothetical protein
MEEFGCAKKQVAAGGIKCLISRAGNRVQMIDAPLQVLSIPKSSFESFWKTQVRA